MKTFNEFLGEIFRKKTNKKTIQDPDDFVSWFVKAFNVSQGFAAPQGSFDQERDAVALAKRLLKSDEWEQVDIIQMGPVKTRTFK